MQAPDYFAFVALSLILLRCVVQLGLEWLNRAHARRHASALPEAFQGAMDDASYSRSVDYTMAKSRLEQYELGWDCLVLLAVLFSGFLPWSFGAATGLVGHSAVALAGWLLAVGFVLSLTDTPFALYRQFRLEQRFGFNTMTLKTWVCDRLKGFALAAVLGLPVLWFLLKIVGWTGAYWWIWGWAALLAFQLLITLLAPVLILPLFNKFTPLPEGSLKQRLLELAARTKFAARAILVMDGSKRSRHSNAFFTGFGRFRRIVLFDTLIEQLTEPELEAVLAHEIGHFKKKHIPKTLLLSAAGTLVGFYLIARLAELPAFTAAFGFSSGGLPPALLLFSLLAGTVTFWLSPLTYWWSRKNEYEADAYAAGVMRNAGDLIGALRKLNEKNLSNLVPHPLYSGFYYSHPTLLEREAALRKFPAQR